MNWLSENYKWVFDGIGAAVLIFLFSRVFKKHAAKKADTSLTARDSQVTNSPVTSGSGNITNIVRIEHPPAAPVPAPVPTTPKPEKPTPNIQMTGAHVTGVFNRHELWQEDVSGDVRAIVIQFTNEPRREGENVGAPIRASLVYKNDQTEFLRIIGNWLNESNDNTEFRVDDSHKLFVGTLCNGVFIVIGKRRVSQQGFVTCEDEPHDLPSFQTVSVTLTDANNGRVLYTGQFRVTLNPLGIVPV